MKVVYDALPEMHGSLGDLPTLTAPTILRSIEHVCAAGVRIRWRQASQEG